LPGHKKGKKGTTKKTAKGKLLSDSWQGGTDYRTKKKGGKDRQKEREKVGQTGEGGNDGGRPLQEREKDLIGRIGEKEGVPVVRPGILEDPPGKELLRRLNGKGTI